MKLKDLTFPTTLIASNGRTMTVWDKIIIEGQIFYRVYQTKYLMRISELELVELLQIYSKRNDTTFIHTIDRGYWREAFPKTLKQAISIVEKENS